MFRISEQITREIRDRVSIVELVGHYIQLKKAGRSYKVSVLFTATARLVSMFLTSGSFSTVSAVTPTAMS